MVEDSPFDVDGAVDALWRAAAAGDHAPGAWQGQLDLDQALAVQLGRLGRRLDVDGDELAGWKVGLTSPRSRAMLGGDERPFGHIVRSRLFRSGDRIPAADLHQPHIEPELCFAFEHPVSWPLDDPDAVRRAVSSIRAGFELNENRPGTRDPGKGPDLPLSVADNLSQWGIVVGDGIEPTGVDVDGITVTLLCDGEAVYEGRSSDVLDNHWSSLARLAEVLHRHGRRIEAGHHVITGAYTRLPVVPGQRWEAHYHGIGSVAVHLT